jgi:hypothetical protein
MEMLDGLKIFIQIAVSGVAFIAVYLAFKFNIESKRFERMSEIWVNIMVLFVEYINRLEDVSNNRVHINLETGSEEWSSVRFKRLIGELSEKINEAASKLYFYLPDKTYDLIDNLIIDLNSCRKIIYSTTEPRMESPELNEAKDKAVKTFLVLKEYSDKIIKIRSKEFLSKTAPKQRHRLEI